MNENVLYFLGAGFSRPFGLPVMADFIEKARDLYFSDRRKFADLGGVLERISEYSVIKNTFDSDLFNIEEVLSILQIEEDLAHQDLAGEFSRFIIRVIKESTPSFEGYPGPLPGNWEDFLVGGNPKNLENELGFFVANLLGVRIEEIRVGSPNPKGRTIELTSHSVPGSRYGIVTLNYDTVLESCALFLNEQFEHSVNKQVQFRKTPEAGKDGLWTDDATVMAKLHGCAEEGLIVPPTWKKGVLDEIRLYWEHAFQLIAGANHIRFIGYSLAVADAYVKYLLKAAIKHNEHLKTVTVICLDSDGSVEKRYRDFIVFPKMRFINAATETYLSGLAKLHRRDSARQTMVIECNKLEEHHRAFVSAH